MVLSSLSDAQKDVLILEQQETIAQQQVTIAALQARIAELEEIVRTLLIKLNSNSTNSNRPPSSDGLKKGPPKPRSLRQQSGKKPGGQPGHPGASLTWSETPDIVLEHRPEPVCDACATPLPQATLAASRQVVDLPDIRNAVTEHRVFVSRCVCGKICSGSFPDEVTAPVQYGSQIRALAVYLTQHQMLPIHRTAQLLQDLFAVSISKRSIQNACIQAASALKPTVEHIAEALRDAAVAGADETGIRIEKSLHWLHTVVTEKLTWLGCHKRRGSVAIEAFDLLPHFRGILVHDGWESYRNLKCLHALCNVHHLRELEVFAKDHGQPWAIHMGALLRQASHAVNVSPENKLEPSAIEEYLREYDALLDQGDAAHPRIPASGKRGKTKQSPAANLLHRLRIYRDDVWRFAHESAVPFTNNLSEQAVRMPKVKQKISGCFRTTKGAERFCIVRSFLETARKQGHKILTTLTEAFQGKIAQFDLT